MRELAQPGASNHDEGHVADIWDQVDRQTDDQLDDLLPAEGPELSAAGRFAEHADCVWGVDEDDALGGDQIGVAIVDEGGLGTQVSELASEIVRLLAKLTSKIST
jgi:hypothetical protein